jgi:uncharacterized repeat protein (TIGR03803 family)
MKKINKFLFLMVVVGLVISPIVAQAENFAVEYNFDGTNGKWPTESLVKVGELLYGSTNQGGANNKGVIFSFNPQEGVFTKLHDFNGTDGGSGKGSLLVHGGIIYGFAGEGANNRGVIYSFNPNNDAYAKLHDFVLANGSEPSGALIQSGGLFYGLTTFGGATGRGVIFSFNPLDNTYAKLHDFDGGNGRNPEGSLFLYNGVMYGLTSDGGENDGGVIFSFDPDEDEEKRFAKLYDLSSASGKYPYGSLIESNGLLYGSTPGGGTEGYGTIFSFNPIEKELEVLYSLSDESGNGYGDSLVVVDGIIYGMFNGGGLNNGGVVFSFNRDGNVYTKLYDLGPASGSGPEGTPIVSNGKLYGLGRVGGENNFGTIFSYLLPVVEVEPSPTPEQPVPSSRSQSIRRSVANPSGSTPPPANIGMPVNPTTTDNFTLPRPNITKPFTTTLQQSQSQADVRLLQIFLNSDPDTRVSTEGAGSPGNETNFFGPLTKQALIKFQEKYTSEILTPLGLTKGTGFFGPMTRAKINQLLGL